MRQKFKGKTLYTKRVVRNILKIFNQCDNPTDWYQDAHDYAKSLASSYGYNVSQVCGVIAALSPLKSWDYNKVLAQEFLETGSCGHTRVMQDKARRILESTGDKDTICEILSGNKITSFYLNMFEPAKSKAVTIDRHALAVALGRNITEDEGKGITVGQYEFFVRCYTKAADTVEVTPLLMQSATWEKWRELKKSA